MSEKSKFVAYKKKLQGICDENNFVFRFRQDRYPITLTIKPATGVDEQMSLLEKAEDTNVTSPDASLVFMVLDGDLKLKISDTFTISETLFNKLKNLFKNMHYYWLQYFFREIILRFAKEQCKIKMTSLSCICCNLSKIQLIHSLIIAE